MIYFRRFRHNTWDWILAFWVVCIVLGLSFSGCASVGPWQSTGGSVFKCRWERPLLGLGKETLKCRACRDEKGRFAPCEVDRVVGNDETPDVSEAVIWPGRTP